MEHTAMQVACTMCGASATRRSWGGCECPACGSVSVLNVPSQAELDRYYAHYNETYKGGARHGDNQVRYGARYLALVRRVSRKGSLVDIGSATNPFPSLAARAGYTVSVVDYARPKSLPKEVEFVCGHLNDQSVLSAFQAPFDLVTLFAVLEHCSRPRLACETLAALCKPGGHIFISTPEIGTALTNNALGRSGWFWPPEHLHLVSAQAVECMFARLRCRMVQRSRLELNWLRWAARYGIGAAEAFAGALLRTLAPHSWERARETRVQRFKGISLFVFRKDA